MYIYIYDSWTTRACVCNCVRTHTCIASLSASKFVSECCAGVLLAEWDSWGQIFLFFWHGGDSMRSKATSFRQFKGNNGSSNEKYRVSR